MKKIRTMLSGFIAASAFIFVSNACATFVAAPMEFHLSESSGDNKTHMLVVRNRGDESIALKIYTNDFFISPEGKEEFLEPGKTARSCAKWIQLSSEEMELPPNQSKLIRFKLSVPLEASGTYWSMIFIEQISKPTIKTALKDQRQFNIMTFQRIGIRVFEDTPVSKPKNGKISEMAVVWDAEKGRFKVTIKFENEGDLLLKCRGFIEIKDEKGDALDKISVEQFNCYPGSKRVSENFVTAKPPPGKYAALATIDYESEDLVAGEAFFEVVPAVPLNLAPKEPPKNPPENPLTPAKISKNAAKEGAKPGLIEKKISFLEKINKSAMNKFKIAVYRFKKIWKKYFPG